TVGRGHSDFLRDGNLLLREPISAVVARSSQPSQALPTPRTPPSPRTPRALPPLGPSHSLSAECNVGYVSIARTRTRRCARRRGGGEVQVLGLEPLARGGLLHQGVRPAQPHPVRMHFHQAYLLPRLLPRQAPPPRLGQHGQAPAMQNLHRFGMAYGFGQDTA